MTRFLILTLLICLAYSLWTFVRRSLSGSGQSSPPAPKASGHRERGARGEDLVQDPQCGTYVPRGEAVEALIGTQRRYFCSAACRDAFRAEKSD